jgi:hypothetical protein
MYSREGMTVVHLSVITHKSWCLASFLLITNYNKYFMTDYCSNVKRKAEKMSSLCSLNFCIILFFKQNDLKILQCCTDTQHNLKNQLSDYVRKLIDNDCVQPRFASMVLRSLRRLSEARLPRYALYTTVLLHNGGFPQRCTTEQCLHLAVHQTNKTRQIEIVPHDRSGVP